MFTSSNTKLAEVPIGGNGGIVWNRLHSEREDICEAMLKEPSSFSDRRDAQRTTKPDDVSAANWHRELLQARLRKVDDALDRLMSGSYGNCSKCGKWIEDTKLDFDPAIEFCLGCWEPQQVQMRSAELTSGTNQTPDTATPVGFVEETIPNSVSAGIALTTLIAFDTILIRTRNSDYRILLLDPNTGRSLVEGGSHFAEPSEAILFGSTCGAAFRHGWIGIGSRLDMWVKDKLVSTSPVQMVSVEHQKSTESAELLSAVH